MKERQDKSIDVVRRNDSNLKNNRYEESSMDEKIVRHNAS